MPPAVADISLVRKQVLEMLVLMPVAARYSDSIGTNSFMLVLQELTDKILIIDEAIVTQDIITQEGHPYINKFMTLSSTFSSGDRISEHLGVYGDVLVAPDIGGTYGPSTAVKSREEILRMVDNATLYGGPSRHHFIQGHVLYHAGYQAAPSGKVYYPVFTKSSTLCQCPDAYTDVLISGTIDLCEKLNSDDPIFKKNHDLYMLGRSMIKAGAEFIPAATQLSAMLAKGQ